MKLKKLKNVFDIISEFLAVALIVIYIIALANAQWGFITNNGALNFFKLATTYGSLLLVGVVGMEALSKRCFLFRLIFYIAVAIIVLFLFFPGTYENLITLFK